MKLITTSYSNNTREVTETNYTFNQSAAEGGMQMVNFYPEVEYQTMLGFGGAITEAAGYTYSKLTEENKKRFLEEYFGQNGNKYNMVRCHIDSCDFSLGNYSAITEESDVEMKTFSLMRDEQYILPLLKAAQEESGKAFDLMLSPWSPPAFMKTNGEKNHGGKLKPEFRKFWADYFCRYIEEYEKRGLKVSRITIQNEPEAVQTWDSCVYTAEEEKVFLRDYLYPSMVEHGLTHVKVDIWDHNKERMFERAKETIDADTDKMIDGIAFHWYTGDHFDAVSITRDAFPGKELIFSEGCVEYSRFDASQLKNAQMYAHDMIGNLNAGMTGFLDWNILLDVKGGPNHVGNNCDAPVMSVDGEDNFVQNLSFYYIGHFSRYIEKGAKRIACTKYTDKLEITGFKNPDGSIVCIILNRTTEDIPVTLRLDGKAVDIMIPQGTISTGIIQ